MTERAFTFQSVLLRLLLAVASGAILGFGRSRKRRAAGLRTYILTSIGACMAILLGEYDFAMLRGPWAFAVEQMGMKYDVSRYGAQVIAGIGFLGAGTIISAGHQQVSGLTTATGLFAAACLGMAAGTGFYECVIVVLIPLILILDCSYPLEANFKRRLRNITIFVQFEQLEDLTDITALIQSRGATIFEFDVEQAEQKDDRYPSVIMALRLSRERASHSELLSSVAELPCVRSVHELIS